MENENEWWMMNDKCKIKVRSDHWKLEQMKNNKWKMKNEKYKNDKLNNINENEEK